MGALLRPCWAAVTTMALLCVPTTASARRVAPLATSLPLEMLTRIDAARAGVAGTGCTWRMVPDRVGRLAMTDDRAAVRRDGKVITMKLAPGAKPLFLTYDRWVGGGVLIVVRDTGRVVRRGYEFSETAARIDLTAGGHTTSIPGRLNCGS